MARKLSLKGLGRGARSITSGRQRRASRMQLPNPWVTQSDFNIDVVSNPLYNAWFNFRFTFSSAQYGGVQGTKFVRFMLDIYEDYEIEQMTVGFRGANRWTFASTPTKITIGGGNMPAQIKSAVHTDPVELDLDGTSLMIHIYKPIGGRLLRHLGDTFPEGFAFNNRQIDDSMELVLPNFGTTGTDLIFFRTIETR